jgi:uncharacterized protein (TIGR00369 family)
MTPEDQEVFERIKVAFAQLVPHNLALGLELLFFDRETGVAVMRLPYRDDLVGDPETGVIHGGAITSLLDACSGGAVFVRRWDPDPIATLDLRIDYLKPATPKRDVFAKATCYKATRNVAFVRATAYHDEEDEPIATAAGTFMLSTRGQFVQGAKK